MTINIGFFAALFLVLFVLKQTNVIAWSWWWVTAPLWGPTVLALVFFAFIGLTMVISYISFLNR